MTLSLPAAGSRAGTLNVAGERLVTEPRLAEMLDLSRHTLGATRRRGEAPPSVRIGKSFFYRLPAVAQWLREREGVSTKVDR